MEPRYDFHDLIEGAKAQCGTGILFWLVTVWFSAAILVAAMMPFAGLLSFVTSDPAGVVICTTLAVFGSGAVLATVVWELNCRKDERERKGRGR